VARVVTNWTLPATPLDALNPFLADAADAAALRGACDDDRDDGAVCYDRPAVGSGLAAVAPGLFVGVTDRGPNQDCGELAALDGGRAYPAAAGKAGKGFPVRAFAPTLVYFSLSPGGGAVNVVRSVPLAGTNGTPVTGLPNTARDDTPYAAGCGGEPLAYDVGGLDTEDVAPIPDTDLLVLVEEYAPSVVLVHGLTGRILARYVPERLAAELSSAPYPVIGALPDVLLHRRKNRGFEALAVAADGRSLLAVVQSPLGSTADAGLVDNVVIRAVRMAIHVDARDAARLVYDGMFAIEGSPPAAYTVAPNRAADLKYSAAAGLADGGFLVLERGVGQVKLFRVDVTAATTRLDGTAYGGADTALERDTNGARSLASVGVTPLRKVLVWDSARTAGGTDAWAFAAKQEGLVVLSRATVLLANDNDFGLARAGPSALVQVHLGRSLSGATVCDEPTLPAPPTVSAATVDGAPAVSLVNLGTYRRSSKPDGGAAEQVSFDPTTGALYGANGLIDAVDVYAGGSVPPSFLSSVPFGGFVPTSTAVCGVDGSVAVSLAAAADGAKGRIALLAPTKSRAGAVTGLTVARTFEEACFLPDFVTFSADCTYVVAACEGEGATVPGSVFIHNTATGGVVNAGFDAFDGKAAELRAKGVRLVESDTPSVDFEPEYVAIVGNTAYVVLQESNALAVVDLAEGVVAEVKSLGYMDRSLAGNGLDASDRDGKINIRPYPRLFGMPQPDGMAAYTSPVDGEVYLVMANEGDAKDGEEIRAGDLVTDRFHRQLPVELRALVSDKGLLGRLKVTSTDGYDAATNTQTALYAYGGRSLSILSARTGAVVYNSGELMARVLERDFPYIFNSQGVSFDDEDRLEAASQEDLLDARSDDKGAEPESVAIYPAPNGRVYAVVGLERTSVLTVWDVTGPADTVFVAAAKNHPTGVPATEVFAAGAQGDLDPEGLAVDVAGGKLFVAGAVSNTVSAYALQVE